MIAAWLMVIHHPTTETFCCLICCKKESLQSSAAPGTRFLPLSSHKRDFEVIFVSPTAMDTIRRIGSRPGQGHSHVHEHTRNRHAEGHGHGHRHGLCCSFPAWQVYQVKYRGQCTRSTLSPYCGAYLHALMVPLFLQQEKAPDTVGQTCPDSGPGQASCEERCACH